MNDNESDDEGTGKADQDMKADGKLMLIVKIQNGDSICFRVKATTQFGRVHQAIQKRLRVDKGSYRLGWDERLLLEDDSPIQLGWAPGRTYSIDLLMTQLGGGGVLSDGERQVRVGREELMT